MASAIEIFSSPWGWLIAGVCLVIGEILIPGLLFLWIGSGALAVGAMLFLWPDAPLPLQLILMAGFMFASVGLGVWLQHGKNDAQTVNRGLAGYVGQELVVARDFEAGVGRIHVNDTSYSARSTDPIQAGTKVVITAYRDGAFQVVRVDH